MKYGKILLSRGELGMSLVDAMLGNFIAVIAIISAFGVWNFFNETANYFTAQTAALDDSKFLAANVATYFASRKTPSVYDVDPVLGFNYYLECTKDGAKLTVFRRVFAAGVEQATEKVTVTPVCQKIDSKDMLFGLTFGDSVRANNNMGNMCPSTTGCPSTCGPNKRQTLEIYSTTTKLKQVFPSGFNSPSYYRQNSLAQAMCSIKPIDYDALIPSIQLQFVSAYLRPGSGYLKTDQSVVDPLLYTSVGATVTLGLVSDTTEFVSH